MPRASAIPFTTITMNKRYAARLHRDSRNDGPSIGNAVGKFSGGKLLYWQRDDGRVLGIMYGAMT